VRYNTDGSLDTTFGTDGVVKTASFGTGTYLAQPRDAALLPDGKVVAVGVVFHGSAEADVALARYNPDGSLDDTFGTGGVVSSEFGGEEDGHAVAVQADGKLVVAGLHYHGGSGSDSFLTRYNADGTLDTGFGVNGLQSVNMAEGDNDTFNAVLLQPDNRIIALGDRGMARFFGDAAPPAADAGGPYSVSEGGSVVLDAGGTTDSGQDAATLTYVWDLDGDSVFGETGAAALRGDETGVRPTFAAAGLDGPAPVTVRLRVTNSAGGSDEDSATVSIINAPPTASVDGPSGALAGGAGTIKL
jgi:uncharacterized delta-60 repeat protein